MIKAIKMGDGIAVKTEGKGYELFVEFIEITAAVKESVEKECDEQRARAIMEALFRAGVGTPVEELTEKQKKDTRAILMAIMRLNKKGEEDGQQNSNDQP